MLRGLMTKPNSGLATVLATALFAMFLLTSSVLADGPNDLFGGTESGGNEAYSVQSEFMSGELVVKLADGDTISIDVVNHQFGTRTAQYLPQLRIYLLSVGMEEDLEQLASEIRALSFVETAHPNYLADPLQPVQGSFPFSDLDHTGDFEHQEAAIELGLDDVHTISTGAGVKVAVIDGGVNYSHPAFGGKVVSGYDYVNEDSDAFDEEGGDNTGHGTFVAGIVHLVAPDAEIHAYRVSETSGNSDGYLVAEAILQAVKEGCQVINLSMVMKQEHSAIADAIAYARAHNVLVVVAAGNEQLEDPVYPASDPNVIAVAAVDSLDLLASFSRFGADIDLCAPGTNVYSPYTGTDYAWWEGTSFAAPFVSGELALIISQNLNGYSWALARSILEASATDIDPLNPDFAGKLGVGLMNPGAALNMTSGGHAFVFPDKLSFTSYENVYYFAPFTGEVSLTSTNAPAAYSASVHSVDGSPIICYTSDSVGVTDNTLTVLVEPTAPVGTYTNIIEFVVDGVQNPVELEVELTVLPATQTGETAWLEHGPLTYEIEQGSYNFPTDCIRVLSTNSPTLFSVSQRSTTPFATIFADTGLAGDSVCFMITGNNLAPGDYTDTLVFLVDGVVNNPLEAVLNLHVVAGGGGTTEESIVLTPDSLVFEVVEGQVAPVMLHGCTFISSTNQPASYVAHLYDPSDGIVVLEDSTGTTGDSSCVLVNPDGLSQGVYYNTVIYDVDGIDDPAQLAVVLYVLPEDTIGPRTAWVEPNPLRFAADEGSTSVLTGSAVIQSSTPSTYTAQVVTDTEVVFIQLLKSTGMTPDTVGLTVDPSAHAPGVYYNWVQFTVDGEEDPVLLTVQLTVYPVGDSAAAYFAPNTFNVSVEAGSADTVAALCSLLSSSNAPAPFTVAWTGYNPGMIELLTTAGVTNDSVYFVIHAGGLQVGEYYDSLVAHVDGIDEDASLHIRVQVTNTTPAGPTASLSQSTFSYTTIVGSDETQYGCTYLTSTNQPASYSVTFRNTPRFTTLENASGTTDDSVCFFVDGSALTPGMYADTLLFNVDGVTNNPRIAVIFLSVGTGATTGTASISPTLLTFTAPENSYDTLSDSVYVSSTNAPAQYFASVQGGSQWLLLPDSVGYTDENLEVMVDPAGLSAGIYYDTVVIAVDGVDGWLDLTVQLTVGGVQAVSTQNSPNPFNPTTEIRFTLPSPMSVRLDVYNIVGQKVSTLVDGRFDAGDHYVTWDASGRASGIYFYRLMTSDFTVTRKMLLLK